MNEFADYSRRMQATLAGADWSGVGKLADELLDCWRTGRRVFMCGNGGSAVTPFIWPMIFSTGFQSKPVPACA